VIARHSRSTLDLPWTREGRSSFLIHGANELSLQELAQRSKELIGRAKTGEITADAITGGTFAVSNLGGLGIHWFIPVLTAPEVGILGIGAIAHLLPRKRSPDSLALIFDHQALDGAAAAPVLGAFASAIEGAGLTVTVWFEGPTSSF
jgi:pyruvate dehydrogenase E2 component (dihydrolipoamide acetyltransferase)